MKKLTKVTSILGLAIISICALVFGVTATVLYAHAEGETLTERELYNATNTYNVNDSIFDENGDIIPVDEKRKNSDIQYRLSYDMSAKNGNQVMSITQVTVLTHGLGGSARHWSNNFSEK